MIISVITYFMSLSDNAPNEIWVTFRIHADEKKRRLYLRRLQDIENLRRPLRVGPVVKCQGDLVRVARTLMIQGRELRKFGVVRSKITILVHSQSSHSVGSRFIYRHDLTIADVGDGVGPTLYLQERPRV